MNMKLLLHIGLVLFYAYELLHDILKVLEG